MEEKFSFRQGWTLEEFISEKAISITRPRLKELDIHGIRGTTLWRANPPTTRCITERFNGTSWVKVYVVQGSRKSSLRGEDVVRRWFVFNRLARYIYPSKQSCR